MEDPFEAVITARKFFLLRVVNPLDFEFSQLLTKISEFSLILLDAQKTTYFCSNCQKKHTSKTNPQKYQDHRIYAQNLYKFPSLNTSSFIQIQKMQIVGVYYAGSADYLQTLPFDAILELRPEPFNEHDPNAVAVYHQNQKLGYLPRGPNQSILNAIQRNASVQCIFETFRPAHFQNASRRRSWGQTDQYFPDRGNILITIYDYENIDLALRNLVELDNLGHSQVIPFFKQLGPLVIQKLSRWEEHEPNSKISSTLNRLAIAYQIPIKKAESDDSSLSLIL